MEGTAPALEWLAGVLWPEEAGLRVVSDGSVPPGFRVARSYVVVPSLERARFLLPVGSRRAAVGALVSFNALRDRKTRRTRSALAASLRTGVGRFAFRDRLEVCVRAGSEAELPETHLEEILGGRVAVAIGVGRQGPNRKPTLQVFSPEGRPLAYVKIGWNAFTEGLVRNEAAMLRTVGEARPEGLAAPELLHAERRRGLEFCVAGPLPPGARRFPSDARPPVEALRALLTVHTGTLTVSLGASPYVERLRARIAGLPDGRGRDSAAAALDATLARWSDRDVLFGSWHGDLVPWNVARIPGGAAAWDWEHGGAGVPAGMDALHWYFQVAFTAKRTDVAAAVNACARGTEEARRLGQPADASLMLALYLLELFLRYEEAAAAGAGRNPRLADLGEALRGATRPS